MEILRLILLFVHLLALAALFGGLLVQAKSPEKRITPIIRDGAGTTFLAGLLLVGVLEGLDADVNHMKDGVKLAIGLVVLVLAMMNLRKESISQGVWATMLGLTVVNIAVAVFWSPAHQAPEDADAAAVHSAVVAIRS